MGEKNRGMREKRGNPKRLRKKGDDMIISIMMTKIFRQGWQKNAKIMTRLMTTGERERDKEREKRNKRSRLS